MKHRMPCNINNFSRMTNDNKHQKCQTPETIMKEKVRISSGDCHPYVALLIIGENATENFYSFILDQHFS